MKRLPAGFRPALCVAGVALCATLGPAPCLALEDISSSVAITTANARTTTNPVTRIATSTADVTVRNTSSQAIAPAPLHAVISINNATGTVTMPGALGGPTTEPYGKYYYSPSLPGGRLSPGASLTFRLTFARQTTVRFTYTIAIYGTRESVNSPPTADAGPDQTLTAPWQGTIDVTLDASGSADADGTIVSYQWTGTPDPADAVGPTVALAPGAYTFTLSVTDNGGATATDSVAITVNEEPPPNRPPDFTTTPLEEAVESLVYYYQAQAADPEGGAVAYRLSQGPGSMRLDAASGLIVWHPGAADVGAHAVEVQASDPEGLAATQSFTLNVGDINGIPVITTVPGTTVKAGESYRYAAQAYDADGDAVTFGLAEGPAGMTVAATTGVLAWSPGSAAIGAHPVRVTVTDPQGASSGQAYTLNVIDTSLAVTSPTGERDVLVGQTLTLPLEASQDTALFEVTPLPSNAAVTGGTFTFTPEEGQEGWYDCAFTATLGDLTAQSVVRIRVARPNEPPVIAAPGSHSVLEGERLTLTIEATDADGDALEYSAPGLALENAYFDQVNRRLVFTPDYGQAGQYAVQFAVSDGRESATAEAQITVEQVTPPSQLLDLVVDEVESPTLRTTARISGSVTGETAPPAAAQPAVLITGLSPSSARQGATAVITITGYNTEFAQGSTTASFGAGVSVQSLTVNSATSAEAAIAVDPLAQIGARSVRMTVNGAEIYSVVGFSVAEGRASVSGQVVDSFTKEPLAGATALISGTQTSVMTGADGRFTLEEVVPGTRTVLLTLLNYESVQVELAVARSTAIDVGEPVEMRALARKPSPGGTLPRAASVPSVVDRGVSDKDTIPTMDAAKALISDTLIAVGGNQVGVIDAAGNQLNPRVDGLGVLSMTPQGIERHARALTEGGVYTLKDVVWTIQTLFRFSGSPLTLDSAVRGFQQAVDEAWADPGAPASGMAIVLFNEGRSLSPQPPVVSADTRFNRFQCFLLMSSFIVYNYAAIETSVDTILEERGIDWRQYTGTPAPAGRASAAPPSRAAELGRSAAQTLLGVLGAARGLIGPSVAYAAVPPGHILPPNTGDPASRLSMESAEVYQKCWKSVLGDTLASIFYATLKDMIMTTVVSTAVGMMLGSTGGVVGALGGAMIGAIGSSIVGASQAVLQKVLLAWIAAKTAVAFMPVAPLLESTAYDEEGNLLILFERSGTEIQNKTDATSTIPGVPGNLGVRPEMLNFTYVLYECRNASDVTGDSCVGLYGTRLSLDYDDERNFDSDYPTGRLKFVLERARLAEGRHYYRVATIQYVRNLQANLLQGVAEFDADQSGSVEFAEFDGTQAEFDSFDLDRDGRLSPQEFARNPLFYLANPLIVKQLQGDPYGGFPAEWNLYPKSTPMTPGDYAGMIANQKQSFKQNASSLQTAHNLVQKTNQDSSYYQYANEMIMQDNTTTTETFANLQQEKLDKGLKVVSYANREAPGGLNSELIALQLGREPTAAEVEHIQRISQHNQTMQIEGQRMQYCNDALKELDGLALKHQGDPEADVTVKFTMMGKDGRLIEWDQNVKAKEIPDYQQHVKGEFRDATVEFTNAETQKNLRTKSFLKEGIPDLDTVEATRAQNLTKSQAALTVNDEGLGTGKSTMQEIEHDQRTGQGYEFDPGQSYGGINTTMDIVGVVADQSEFVALFLGNIRVLKSEFSACLVYDVGEIVERERFAPSAVPSPNFNDPGAMLRSHASAAEPKAGWILREYPGEEQEPASAGAGFPPDFLTADLKGRVYAINMNSTTNFGGRIFRFTPTKSYGFDREYVGNVNYYSLAIQYGRPANPVAMCAGPEHRADATGIPQGMMVQDLYVADYDIAGGGARIVTVPVSYVDRYPNVYGSGDRSHLVGQQVVASADFQFTGPSDMELGPDPAGGFASWSDNSAVFLSDEQRIFALYEDTSSGEPILRTVVDLAGRRFSGLAFDRVGKLYFADYQNGEIWMLPWSDLQGLLARGETIATDEALRSLAWLMKEGLASPGDIELEANSLLSERALVVSYREGLERFVLPVVGTVEAGLDSQVKEIRVKHYLEETKAVFVPGLPRRFIAEPSIEAAENRKVTLRIHYQNGQGQDTWVDRTVTMARFGATVLPNFK